VSSPARPDAAAIARLVQEFLCERGRVVTEAGVLGLGSLDYVALLLHLESSLDARIDDATFFRDGLPETLHDICDQAALAAGAA
jgi:acyl carrier protein